MTDVGSNNVRGTKKFVEATRNDILLGRGKHADQWDGNLLFRNAISQNAPEYHTSDNSRKRDEIAEKVMAEVRASGGRFLQLQRIRTASDSPQQWIVISEAAARSKVKQALRDASKPSPLSKRAISSLQRSWSLPSPTGAVIRNDSFTSLPSYHSWQRDHCSGPSVRSSVSSRMIELALMNASYAGVRENIDRPETALTPYGAGVWAMPPLPASQALAAVIPVEGAIAHSVDAKMPSRVYVCRNEKLQMEPQTVHVTSPLMMQHRRDGFRAAQTTRSFMTEPSTSNGTSLNGLAAVSQAGVLDTRYCYYPPWASKAATAQVLTGDVCVAHHYVHTTPTTNNCEPGFLMASDYVRKLAAYDTQTANDKKTIRNLLSESNESHETGLGTETTTDNLEHFFDDGLSTASASIFSDVCDAPATDENLREFSF